MDGLVQLARLQQVNGQPEYVLQCLDGFGVQFLRLPGESAAAPDALFLLLVRRKGVHSLRVYLLELDQSRAQAQLRPPLSRSETFRLEPSTAPTPDFPLFAVAAPRVGLLYLLSKHGRLVVCDLHSCVPLLPERLVCRQPVIAARLDPDSQGVLCVCRDGRVLLLEPTLPALADRLAAQGPRLAPVVERLRAAGAGPPDEVTRL